MSRIPGAPASPAYRFFAAACILAAATFSAAADSHIPLLADLRLALELRGFRLDWKESSQKENYIRLADATVATRSPYFPPFFQLGEVVFRDVTKKDGRLEIGLITMPWISAGNDQSSVNFTQTTLTNISFSILPDNRATIFRRFGMGPSRVRSTRPIYDFSFDVENEPLGDGGSALYASGSITLRDLASFRFTSGEQSLLERLGHKMLGLKLTLSTNWTTDNFLRIKNFQVTARDLIEVTARVELENLTSAALALIVENSANGLKGPTAYLEPEAQQRQQRIAEMVRKAQLKSLNIVVKDLSLTGQLLDDAAKRQGIAREDVIAQADASLRMSLAWLQDVGSSAQVSEIFRRFLNDPATLEISMNPPEPVTLEQVLPPQIYHALDMPPLGLKASVSKDK